jgi:integrase
MPKLLRSIPSYRKHRASGQAIVSLNGRDFYLGPHGTKASRIEYDRFIAEWLQHGRQIQPPQMDGCLTVVELIAAYLRHMQEYYRKPDGTPTSEVRDIIQSLRPVKSLYSRQPCSEFGPTALKAVRQKMVDDGLSRKTINQRVGRIKRMFKWGAAAELISAEIPQALSMVEGLKLGRSAAHETEPIRPVEDSIIEATLPHLPTVAADMVRFQRLTGCRPAEVCTLRPCDIDLAGHVWKYRPASDTTQHHGKERTIYVGPQGQAVLLWYLV